MCEKRMEEGGRGCYYYCTKIIAAEYKKKIKRIFINNKSSPHQYYNTQVFDS